MFKHVLLVQWPLNVDFSKPELVGMKGTRNFYLQTDQQVKIGLWLVYLSKYTYNSFKLNKICFQANVTSVFTK